MFCILTGDMCIEYCCPAKSRGIVVPLHIIFFELGPWPDAFGFSCPIFITYWCAPLYVIITIFAIAVLPHPSPSSESAFISAMDSKTTHGLLDIRKMMLAQAGWRFPTCEEGRRWQDIQLAHGIKNSAELGSRRVSWCDSDTGVKLGGWGCHGGGIVPQEPSF